MSTIGESAIYDEMLSALAEAIDADRILAYRLSPHAQARLDALLERNWMGTLDSDESFELDEFERVEHLIRLLKAKFRAKQHP